MPNLRLLAASLVALWLALPAAPAWADTEVDLALVLAVDVSRSMDTEEQELQREGFVEAFRSALIHEAIARGTLGRIAVTYVEWSGVGQHTVVVPWTLVDGPGTADAFSERLASTPIGRVFSTSISSAIDFSARLLDDSGFEAMRRVIDVSGDGPNNQGRTVTFARDEAVAKGITINGLPLMLKRPTGWGDIENLDQYYQDCVIGGPGSFIVPVRERKQFADAIRTKLVREIADLRDPHPLVQRAQERERMNCLIGEQMRRRNYGP
ncbi:DUF1194 domain-containing protein [Salinarimonas soli]|uniref:DUF1194 domain-containing protein n=1 Tax=Salinarimonas soli TaxID=1638099 RepID=UPI001F0B5B15|nr:DUF1194 domain-containing protein [Salinarimonas soli]